MSEIWKDIDGLIGYYQVSNLGRIRSLDRLIIRKDGRKRYFQGQLLKPFLDKSGQHKYYQINLQINRKKFPTRTIHQLVATAFIPNPNNKPCVNHKDGNKLNNCEWNLEWCDYVENQKHAMKTGLFIPHTQKISIDIANEIRNEYKKGCISQRELGLKYGLARVNINKIINNKCWNF